MIYENHDRQAFLLAAISTAGRRLVFYPWPLGLTREGVARYPLRYPIILGI